MNLYSGIQRQRDGASSVTGVALTALLSLCLFAAGCADSAPAPDTTSDGNTDSADTNMNVADAGMNVADAGMMPADGSPPYDPAAGSNDPANPDGSNGYPTDGSNPADPAYVPTDGANPTDPADPNYLPPGDANPTDPADPNYLPPGDANPTDPADPNYLPPGDANPTDPADPNYLPPGDANPTDPADPNYLPPGDANPTDPADPNYLPPGGANTTDPANFPTDGANPTDPSNLGGGGIGGEGGGEGGGQAQAPSEDAPEFPAFQLIMGLRGGKLDGLAGHISSRAKGDLLKIRVGKLTDEDKARLKETFQRPQLTTKPRSKSGGRLINLKSGEQFIAILVKKEGSKWKVSEMTIRKGTTR